MIISTCTSKTIHHSPLPGRAPAVCQHNCACGHSQTCSGLLRGKFLNVFARGEATQIFIPAIWPWGRGRGKKGRSSWAQNPQLSMSDHKPLPLPSSWTLYNHWKKLLQLTRETAGFLVLKAPDILLLPHYWGQWDRGRWLSVPSDSIWIVKNHINSKLPDPEKRATVNCKPILVQWYNAMLC